MDSKINNQYPLITLVIPVFNLEHYVSDMLDSVYAQDYPNFEVIIIDDKSTDKSVNRLQELIEQYSKWNVPTELIVLPKHKGVSYSRNLGIKKAKGKYLAFLDGDDTIAPKFLSVLYQGITKFENVMVSSIGFSWGGRLDDWDDRPANFNLIDKLKMFDGVSTRGHYISGMVWNKLYDLEAVRASKVLFDEDLDFAEDHWWIANLIASPAMGTNFSVASEKFYFKVTRSDSAIHKASAAQREREHQLDLKIEKIGEKLEEEYF